MYTFKQFYDLIFEQDNSLTDYLKKHESALKNSKKFIQKCIAELSREKPPIFFTMLKQFKIIPTDQVDTMAVDDCGNLYYNPMFVMEELVDDNNSDVVKGVLVHEVMHIIDRTHNREKVGREKLFNDNTKLHMRQIAHQIGNLAFDLIINRDVTLAGYKLPSAGIIPEFRTDSDGKQRAFYKFDLTIPGDTTPDIVEVDITRFTSEKAYDMFVWAHKKAITKLYNANMINEKQYNKYMQIMEEIK